MLAAISQTASRWKNPAAKRIGQVDHLPETANMEGVKSASVGLAQAQRARVEQKRLKLQRPKGFGNCRTQPAQPDRAKVQHAPLASSLPCFNSGTGHTPCQLQECKSQRPSLLVPVWNACGSLLATKHSNTWTGACFTSNWAHQKHVGFGATSSKDSTTCLRWVPLDTYPICIS